MFCGMASSNDERTKRSGSQNSEQRRVIKKYALSLSLVVILLMNWTLMIIGLVNTLKLILKGKKFLIGKTQHGSLK